MQIGIDSFAAAISDPATGLTLKPVDRMDHLLEEMELADERGWPPTTRAHFDAVRGPTGALLIGDAKTVAEKILSMNDVLGGISRMTFQMGVSTLPHEKMMRAIEILGARVAPIVKKKLESVR